MKKNSGMIGLFSFMRHSFLGYLFGIFFSSVFSMMIQILISTMFLFMFNALDAKNINKMFEVIFIYNGIILIIFAISPVFNYLLKRQSAITSGHIRHIVFSKLEKLPLSFYRKNHSGELISRLTNDISEVEKAYSQYFTRFFQGLITGIGTLIYSFFIDWRLSLFSLFGGVLILLINLYYSKVLNVVNKEILERLANVTKKLTNLLDGIHIVKMFNIYNIILGKFNKGNEEVLDKSIEKVKKEAFISTINALVDILSFMGIATLGAYLVLIDQISIGTIIAIVQLQNGISMLINSLGGFISNLQSSLAASTRIYAVLDECEEEEKYVLEGEINEPVNDYAVVFNDICFKYVDDDKLVLNQLSFKLPKGKVFALVGPSGGGKSTVIKLILNYFPPNHGQMYIEGKSISEQTIKEIRDLIAYVPQDAFLFTGSILENIRYGNVYATEEDIYHAAKLANASEFIENLPDGYHTFIGENGAQLSGGQKQRIAIARAILKNAPILLLDEATSALDSESEQLVQSALDELMKNKSTLIIAHRLSTILHSDQILVIKDGVVAEEGSHNDLLKLENGIYTNLYNKQFNKA